MPAQERAPENRLTIELVPQTCWFSNVRSEVSAPDWDRLRKLTYDNTGNQCQVCGGRGSRWAVECHEIWHYDDNQHAQTLLGLIALCPPCHEVKHMGLANVKGRGDIAVRHLAKVNGWTQRETGRYVADQFALWERRSKFQWILNLEWLKQNGVTANEPKRITHGYMSRHKWLPH